MARVFAAADIGSNTAHLLVAASDGLTVNRLDNTNEWIPLGEVVTRVGYVPKEMVQNLLDQMRNFKRISVSKEAQGLYVFATEGMRAASNHDEVIRLVESQTGVRVDLITPRREAELSVQGILLDSGDADVDMLWEVGGGSVQIGVLGDGALYEEESIPLGTGRIIAEMGLKQPCSFNLLQAAEWEIENRLSMCRIDGISLKPVASGGVARGLWRALHPDGERRIYLEELEYIIWSVSKLSGDKVASRFRVKPKRAGTLLPGALVYRALMRRFHVESMAISEFGIREGAVLEMARGKIGGVWL